MSQRPNRPDLYDENDDVEYEYQEHKRKRKQKILFQKGIVIFVFVLAAALLVFCTVLIFQAISNSGNNKANSASESEISTSITSISSEAEEVSSQNNAVASDPEAWNLQVISPAFPATADFPVPELATITNNGVAYYVDSRIEESLKNMMADAAAATGGGLKVVSGYRSYNFSKKQYDYYYNNYVKQGQTAEAAAAAAEQLEMYPGTNDHQTALAVDFVNSSGGQTASASFDQTAEYTWLRENAKNYGFILRFPADKVDITGVAYQPYHFRYVGVEEAKEMFDKNLCLEEYVGKANAAPPAENTAEPATDSVAPAA